LRTRHKVPLKGIFKTGSEVIADICTECGHILSMRVKNPEKFKPCNVVRILLIKPNSDYNKILNLLKFNGAKDNCYVISYNKDIDGLYLQLSTALEKAIGYGMPSIISCVLNKLLYFESEQVYGSPARYILKKNKATTESF
jgi:hypothetical protein